MIYIFDNLDYLYLFIVGVAFIQSCKEFFFFVYVVFTTNADIPSRII